MVEADFLERPVGVSARLAAAQDGVMCGMRVIRHLGGSLA